MKRFCSIVAAALAVIALVLCLGACSLGEIKNMLNTGNRPELNFSLMPDDTYSVSVGNATQYTNIVIPATYKGKAVTAIDAYGFARSAIESVVIPSSVTSIGDYAFFDCTSLTSVTIPDSVTSIGNYAFFDCTNLASITIPDGVTSIGSYAFEDCVSLTIYCEAESQPSGWSGPWNSSNCPVVWGYKAEN